MASEVDTHMHTLTQAYRRPHKYEPGTTSLQPAHA